jgi:hypothetical protein
VRTVISNAFHPSEWCAGIGYFDGRGGTMIPQSDDGFWDIIDLWVKRGLRHAEEETSCNAQRAG